MGIHRLNGKSLERIFLQNDVQFAVLDVGVTHPPGQGHDPRTCQGHLPNSVTVVGLKVALYRNRKFLALTLKVPNVSGKGQLSSQQR